MTNEHEKLPSGKLAEYLGRVCDMSEQTRLIETEEWKEISGYEGLYWVSNFGRVKSLRKTLKLLPNSKGYFRVGLYNKNGVKYLSVHSLVLRAFFGERPNGYVIEHINHDKKDNRLENVQYVTQHINVRRSVVDGINPYGERHGSAKLTEEQVVEIRFSKIDSKILASKYNVTRRLIRDIRNGIYWKRVTSKGDSANITARIRGIVDGK